MDKNVLKLNNKISLAPVETGLTNTIANTSFITTRDGTQALTSGVASGSQITSSATNNLTTGNSQLFYYYPYYQSTPVQDISIAKAENGFIVWSSGLQYVFINEVKLAKFIADKYKKTKAKK